MTNFHDNVSVVVLNYNRAETTLECLAALHAARTPRLREVVVVDNGSAPEHVALLRQAVDDLVRVVEVGANRYFGEGNNIGVEETTGDYVVFLNNDAFVQPGWLRAMTATMEEDPAVAAVGAMLLFPDGRVQEVGALALPTGDVVQVGKGAMWGPDHYTQVCAVDYCSAACLLVRKDDFTRVGGFSYRYEPAYYEDADLCLKLRRAAGKVVVNPAARVVHIESHTTSDPTLAPQGIVELNREKFLAEWGAWLARRAASDEPGAELAGERTDARSEATPGRPDVDVAEPVARPAADRRLLAAVYTPYEVVPGGGERVIFELLAHLSATLGRDRVALATPHRYSTLRLGQIAKLFGFAEPVAVPRRHEELEGADVEVALVVGNAIVPSVRGFGLRNIYQCQFPFTVPDWYVDAHREHLAEYDEIWVYSHFVRRYVNGMLRYYDLPKVPIRVVYPPATWPAALRGAPWASRRTLLCVGRFFTEGHDKRQDVVIDVLRELVARGLDVELALAGSLHATEESRSRYAELVDYARGLPVRFYPNAGRQQIEDLYSTSAVLVHAAGFELDPLAHPERLEHFGIAPLEAASLGCVPVVYGEGGPAEVIAALGAGATFRTREECVEQVASLLGDPERGAALSEVVRDRSEQFSPAAFRERVSEAFADLGVPGGW